MQQTYSKQHYKYFYKDGTEVQEGDYIKFIDASGEPYGKAHKVYKWETDEEVGLGIDATNPVWIESGKATTGQYGIYPFSECDEFIKVSEEEGLADLPKYITCKDIAVTLTFSYPTLEKFYKSKDWQTLSKMIDNETVLGYEVNTSDN